MSKILVIKHGALGDIVLATGPFKAIREHHKEDHITLLTTLPYEEMLSQSGFFDEIWIDKRPKIYNPFCFFKLLRKIRGSRFTRIYDLQTSERTGWYFRLLRRPLIEWIGTVEGASHRHNTPERTTLHTVERQKQQLEIAGIHALPKPDLSFLKSDISRFALPERYALIVPGGSSHRTGKRWPAHHYAALCQWFTQQGITPVLIGTKAETPVLSVIEAECGGVKNLQGQTSFADVASLARGAVFAIGNDTGPMHIIASCNCPSLVLFSQFSNPALCAPRGEHVQVIQEETLASLRPETVIEHVRKLVGQTK